MSFWKTLFGLNKPGLREHPKETVIRMLVDSRCRVDGTYRVKFNMRKFEAAFERWRRYTGLTNEELAKSIARYRYRPGISTSTGEQTILHTAAEDNKDLVEWLIKLGADVKVTDQRGWTPLETAAYYCQKDVVALLMAQGAKPVSVTFQLASHSNRHAATDGWRYPKEEEVVEVLLQSSGIHEAARWGGYKRVKALLQENPSLIASKDAEGRTPLHHAVDGGYLSEDVIALLIASGADVNARDNVGSPPTPHWSSTADALCREIIANWLRKQGAINENGAMKTTAISAGTSINEGVVASMLKTFSEGSRVRFVKVGADAWYVRS